MTPGFPHSPSHKPPTHLGPYELIEMLGQGGMGTVWKARHTKLDKLVALKLLPPHLMSDADAVNRFEREMKAVGKLEHAHIVRAMDADEADGVHYLVMEYIEGIDLAKLVKQRGPRKLPEACQMIRHAALGLAHAHEHGLVHRDIKPSNLLLSKKGLVKILDLGLARLQTEKAAAEASLTVQGEMMGTPDYMAPEQWQSAHTAGPAADLYALGCTLHYLLTGRSPFATEQSTFGQKMTAHLLHAPPPLPDVFQEVESLYQKLMAKDPAARPASAKAVADELREMIRSWTKSPAPMEAIPWTPLAASVSGINRARSSLNGYQRWWLVTVGVLALLALGGFSIWSALNSTPKSSASTASPVERTSQPQPANDWPQPPRAIAPFTAEQALKYQALWAEYLNVPVEHTNSLGMRFRLIPPGEYDRGTTSDSIESLLTSYRNYAKANSINANGISITEAGIRSEAPRHRVAIRQAFYLAACEVTQKQFEQVMKQNRAYFSRAGAGHDQVDDRQRANLPMENITFEEAAEFCRRLGDREVHSAASDSSAAGPYRLPTDAEWEYACRAGTTDSFWFGGRRGEGSPSVPDTAVYFRSKQNTPAPVGGVKANPFGLHDMHGNVWELCQDFFAEEDYAQFGSTVAESPLGPATGRARVSRGGAYASPNVLCRSSSRFQVTRPAPFVGFRPALIVEAAQALQKAAP
jgi:serine/threonine protein kinase